MPKSPNQFSEGITTVMPPGFSGPHFFSFVQFFSARLLEPVLHSRVHEQLFLISGLSKRDYLQLSAAFCSTLVTSRLQP